MLHLRSVESRIIIEEAFRNHGSNFIIRERAQRKSYIDSKKSWEVAVIETPPFVAIEELITHSGAFHGFRKGRDIVLRFQDQSVAANYCSTGLFFKNLFFRCKVWSSTPKEFQLPRDICTRCLDTSHKYSDCSANSPICKHCDGPHLSRTCPKAIQASQRKHATYAAALMGNKSPSTVKKQTSDSYYVPSSHLSSREYDTSHVSSSIKTVATDICNVFSQPISTQEKYSRVLSKLSSLPDPNKDLDFTSIISDYAMEVDRLRSLVDNLQEQVRSLSLHMDPTKLPFSDSATSSKTSDPSGPSNTAFNGPKRSVNKKSSSYATAIAELRSEASKMDCSYDRSPSKKQSISDHINETQDSNSVADELPSCTKSSAYSKAAQIISASPELVGEDRTTILSLLTDFHQSLNYSTDDDAMISLSD